MKDDKVLEFDLCQRQLCFESLVEILDCQKSYQLLYEKKT